MQKNHLNVSNKREYTYTLLPLFVPTMAKHKKMTARKKLLWAFIALIIIVLLFSVLWVAVLYLWWGNQGYQQQPSVQDIDLTFWTSDGETITIPADTLEGWSATVTVWSDWEAVAEEAPANDLPENPEA